MKKYLSLLTTAVAVSFFALPVHAITTGETKTSVTINSGTLDLVTAPADITFPNMVIDGTTKTVNGTLGNIRVNDFRGIGDGWQVSVAATQFESAVNPSNKLAPNILKLTDGSPVITSPGAGLGPSYQIATATTIDGGSSVEVLSASAGQGLGEWNVAFHPDTLDLTIDTSSVTLDGGNPTTFTSTLTWTVSVGP